MCCPTAPRHSPDTELAYLIWTVRHGAPSARQSTMCESASTCTKAHDGCNGKFACETGVRQPRNLAQSCMTTLVSVCESCSACRRHQHRVRQRCRIARGAAAMAFVNGDALQVRSPSGPALLLVMV